MTTAYMDDRAWVMRPDPAIRHWRGDRLDLGDGLTVLRLGGHFAGGAGALLSGDTVHVAADRRWTTFMRSYPNLVPLSPAEVERIDRGLAPYPFERIYGAFWEREVDHDGKAALERSVARYLRQVRGEAS